MQFLVPKEATMVTTFLALLLALLTILAGLHLLRRRYVPSPLAQQLRQLQISIALQHFRDSVIAFQSREMRILNGYRRSIRELQVAVLMRSGFETHAAKRGPHIERMLRQTEEYALIERYYDRKLLQAVTFWKDLSDARLQSIAGSIRDELLEGLVPVSTVADFLKGERETIRAASHMAVGHYGRMMARMRDIKKAVLAGGGGGLARRR
jgi:hypothetical protein